MLQSVLSSVAIKKPFDILFLQEWQPVAILVIHNNFFFPVYNFYSLWSYNQQMTFEHVFLFFLIEKRGQQTSDIKIEIRYQK